MYCMNLEKPKGTVEKHDAPHAVAHTCGIRRESSPWALFPDFLICAPKISRIR